jgi:hypothetical protein
MMASPSPDFGGWASFYLSCKNRKMTLADFWFDDIWPPGVTDV